MKHNRLRSWLLLGLSLFLFACGNRVDLMSAIPEDEANEVMAALLKADVAAFKTPGKDGNVGVRVEASQVSRALQILSENGLPRERHSGMGQIFKKEGLISSPLEERARYIYALSQELSNTLSRIDGVLYARVHVVLPERGAIGETGTPSTAAVFIKHRDGYELELLQPQIRRLVTNSIPSLSPERISIVFVAAQPPDASAPASMNMARVLGFEVSADSAAGLSAFLWSIFLLLLLLFAALALLIRQHGLPPYLNKLLGRKDA